MPVPRPPNARRAAPRPARGVLLACVGLLGWLAWPALAAALAAQPAAPASGALASPPARCASGPSRADYVSLHAASASALAAAVAHCRSLGYRRVGGVARAVIDNPGAASPELYFQVMVVPPGAAASSASSPAQPPGG